MLIRAFALNSNNKIEITLSELQSLLNAAYEEGVERERNKKVFHWDYPYITCNTNTIDKDTVTLNNTSSSISNLNRISNKIQQVANNASSTINNLDSVSDKVQQVTSTTLPTNSAYTFAMQDDSTYRNVINGAINE